MGCRIRSSQNPGILSDLAHKSAFITSTPRPPPLETAPSPSIPPLPAPYLCCPASHTGVIHTFELCPRNIHLPAHLDVQTFKRQQNFGRGERERLFGSREREGKLEITFPFYGKGTGIRKCYGKGMGSLRLVIPGII